MTERAVVTGGAGFIGSHVAELLLSRGMEVTVLDDLSTGQRSYIPSKAKLAEGSICDLKFVTQTLREADYVFHLAALPRIQPSFDSPLEHEEVNVNGTINCLLALKENKRLKKLVYSASSACYGTPDEFPTSETAAIRPLSPYALQKYAAEQYVMMFCERFGIPSLALRYFNVYGPRSFNPKNPFNAYSSVIGIFHHQLRGKTALTVTGDGTQQRDFVHVQDVARANVAAALSKQVGEIYNVGCGKPLSVLDIAKRFGGNISFVPERKGEAKITWANIDKIRINHAVVN